MSLFNIIFSICNAIAWTAYVVLLLLWNYENRKFNREIKAMFDDLAKDWKELGAKYSQEEVK